MSFRLPFGVSRWHSAYEYDAWSEDDVDSKREPLVKYTFDLSNWPIAIAITPPGLPGSAIDLEDFYEHIERLLARRQKFANIQDLTGASPFDPKRRQRFSQFLRERGEEIKSYMVCNAVVVDNAVSRGVVTAILWVTPSPCPYRVFATRDLALEWCHGMYEAARAAYFAELARAAPSAPTAPIAPNAPTVAAAAASTGSASPGNQAADAFEVARAAAAKAGRVAAATKSALNRPKGSV